MILEMKTSLEKDLALVMQVEGL
ncbi:MAG: hypothetical protein UU09_C0048G0015, partial [Microgenomates group bacterium GW2011_GWA2_40_6]